MLKAALLGLALVAIACSSALRGPIGGEAHAPGCYVLTWADGAQKGAVPDTLGLLTTKTPNPFADSALAVRLSARDRKRTSMSTISWVPGVGDSLLIVMTTGFLGTTIEAVFDSVGFAGRASTFYDADNRPPVYKGVTAKRARCLGI